MTAVCLLEVCYRFDVSLRLLFAVAYVFMTLDVNVTSFYVYNIALRLYSRVMVPWKWAQFDPQTRLIYILQLYNFQWSTKLYVFHPKDEQSYHALSINV